jgi:hypothetical protein
MRMVFPTLLSFSKKLRSRIIGTLILPVLPSCAAIHCNCGARDSVAGFETKWREDFGRSLRATNAPLSAELI